MNPTPPGWISRLLRLFVPGVGVLGLVALALFYWDNTELPPIHSDGYGHYLYLHAVFVQHDLSMRTEVAEWGADFTPNLGLTHVPETGRYINRFPPGQALLMLPSYLLAHASASALGAVPPGFSAPYQAAVLLNGLLALLVGLVLLRKALEELFPPGVVLATLACLTFGTNLFHYGTYDACFSHIYSFALFSGLLWLVPHWYREPTPRRSLMLGLLMGFIILVRNPNALVLLLVPLYGVYNAQTQRERLAFLRTHWRRVLLVALGGLAVLLILFGYWRYTTGRWVTYSYKGYPFHFDQPQVLPVLFSLRKGVFFWAPVLLLAAWGYLRAREKLAGYLLPVLLIFMLQTYLVASWWHWPYGNSFGHRAFTEFSALSALGLGAFFAALRPRARPVVGALCGLLVAMQLVLMVQYWRGVIPGDRTTWEQYRGALLGRG